MVMPGGSRLIPPAETADAMPNQGAAGKTARSAGHGWPDANQGPDEARGTYKQPCSRLNSPPQGIPLVSGNRSAMVTCGAGNRGGGFPCPVPECKHALTLADGLTGRFGWLRTHRQQPTAALIPFSSRKVRSWLRRSPDRYSVGFVVRFRPRDALQCRGNHVGQSWQWSRSRQGGCSH